MNTQLRRALPQGFVTVKEFLATEAKKHGVTTGAIGMRLSQGKYPSLTRVRRNARVVFIGPKENLTTNTKP